MNPLEILLKRKQLRNILILLVFISLAVNLWQPVSSQENSEVETDSGLACSPVDVAFIIDQSRSMSAGGNDPTQQRKFAVEAAIDQLTDIALDICPGVIHRVAIVSFGDTADIDLELSEIGPFNPAQPNEAFTRRETLKQSVRATDMRQTHPMAAFELVRQIFDQHGRAVSGETNRRRAIIFLTDGVPCVTGDYGACGDPNFPFAAYAVDMRDQIVEDFPFDPNLLSREQCLQNLRAQRVNESAPLPGPAVNACLIDNPVGPDAYWESTYIWLIMMRDGGRPYPQSLLTIFEQIAESHAGSVFNVSNNRQEIPTTFRNILEQLTGVRAARLQCGNFAINPYVERARLVFYKADPTVSVKLTYRDVDGNEYVLEDGVAATGGFELAPEDGHSVFGANERYTILNPYPGVWNLSSDDCNNLDAFYEPIAISASSPGVPGIIPQYDRPPYYNERNPYYLEFQLRDERTGQIVPQAEHPRFAIQVSATISGPDDQQFEMVWVPQEQLFRATEPIRARHIGRYEVDFLVTSYRREGELTNVGLNYEQVFASQYTLIQENVDFEIMPVTPFVPEIIMPLAGEVLKPIHISPDREGVPDIAPVLIHMMITDRQGDSVFGSQVPLIFADPDNAFTARITGPTGTDYTTTLRHDSDRPGEFYGQIEGMGAAGEYQLTVELTGSLAQRDYYPDYFETSINFSRQDEIWRFDVVHPAAGTTVTPVHTSPTQSDFSWPPWRLEVEPLAIRIRLVDEGGRVYTNPESIVDYAPRVIVATVTSDERSEMTYLVPDPAAPGEYIGAIADMNTRGEHQLIVDLDLSYPNYTPESVPAQISFERTDTLLTSASTYVGLSVLIVLLIAFMVWRFFAVRNNKITGELIFLDQGAELGRVNLYSGKNWRVIKGRELDEYPQFGLKRMTVHSTSNNKHKQNNEFTGVGFTDQGQEVRIDYVTDDGEKVRGELLGSNSSISFGGLFQVKYEPSLSEQE